MLSSQMKNKIVFVVAIIGLLLGVAQCRPLEDKSSPAPAPAAAAGLVKGKYSAEDVSDEHASASVEDTVGVGVIPYPVSTIPVGPEIPIVPVVVVGKPDGHDNDDEIPTVPEVPVVVVGKPDGHDNDDEIPTVPEVPVVVVGKPDGHDNDDEIPTVPEVPVVVVGKPDGHDNDNKSEDDSSSDESEESEESKENKNSKESKYSKESSEENKEYAHLGVESKDAAVDALIPAPVIEALEASQPAVATVDSTVEPVAGALEAAVKQAVEADSSPVVKPIKDEAIVAVVDFVVEPAATEQAAKTEAKQDAAPVVEDSVAALSSPVEETINTKAIDAEELVVPEATEESASPSAATSETSPKVIIVTPSSDVVTPSDASVSPKVDAVKEVPVAPVEEITKPIESDDSTTESKVEESSKTTEKSSEVLESKN